MNQNRAARGMRDLTEYEFFERGRAERIYQDTCDPEEREVAIQRIRTIDGIPTSGWNTAIPDDIRAQVIA